MLFNGIFRFRLNYTRLIAKCTSSSSDCKPSWINELGYWKGAVIIRCVITVRLLCQGNHGKLFPHDYLRGLLAKFGTFCNFKEIRSFSVTSKNGTTYLKSLVFILVPLYVL